MLGTAGILHFLLRHHHPAAMTSAPPTGVSQGAAVPVIRRSGAASALLTGEKSPVEQSDLYRAELLDQIA